MGANPRVLTAFVQTHLQKIDACAGGVAARVRAALPADSLDAIEKGSRASWLPLGHHVVLSEHLFAEAGRTEGREVCRQTLLAAFDQPFFKPLVVGARAIVGSSFGRFVTWAPRAWPALFREVGDLQWIAEGPGSGRLVLEPAAAAILASPDYVEGIAAAFSALFEVLRCEGEVRATAGTARVEFQLVWRA